MQHSLLLTRPNGVKRVVASKGIRCYLHIVLSLGLSPFPFAHCQQPPIRNALIAMMPDMSKQYRVTADWILGHFSQSKRPADNNILFRIVGGCCTWLLTLCWDHMHACPPTPLSDHIPVRSEVCASIQARDKKSMNNKHQRGLSFHESTLA